MDQEKSFPAFKKKLISQIISHNYPFEFPIIFFRLNPKITLKGSKLVKKNKC